MKDVFVLKEESLRAWERMGYDAKHKAWIEDQLRRWRMDPRLALPYAVIALAGMEADGIVMKRLRGDRGFRDAVVRAGMELARRARAGDFEARNELAELVRDALGPEPEAYSRAETFIDLGGGWRWVRVDREECEGYEGHLMRHCGASVGDMYSLRDPQGKPHVTADVITAPDGLDSGPIHYDRGVAQLRGKANQTPEERYWPMIRKFFFALPERDQVLSDPDAPTDLIDYILG